MFERVGVVVALWVEDCDSIWKCLVGHMVVTDDEVYAKAFGVCYFLYRLYATVEDDYQRDACLMGVVYAFL